VTHTHTQTLTLPEFTRCEFLPAVFGAPCSVTATGETLLSTTQIGMESVAASSSLNAPTAGTTGAGSTNPLPPGVVLWGPSSGGFWEFRSESDKWYFWQGMWLENLSPTQGSFEYRNEAIAFPPTCPPPDHPAPQPATKPLPPSPAKEGEPVNPYKAGDWCVTGWEQAADAWRAYHADRTNQLVIDHARLTDSLRARLAAAEKVVDMSRAYIAAWSRPMVMGFHTWNEDHEAARKALADAVNPLSGGGAA